MGRRPKEPPSEEVFAALEKNDPDRAYMKRKQSVIGKNVREHRKLRKFSVENLAEYLELSASYVGLLERGDRCPSLKIVYRLCDLYDISPNELLQEPPRPDKKMEIGEKGARYNEKRKAAALMSYTKRLSSKKMELLIDYAKMLDGLEQK